ncbi:NAD(P)/FAD-dependent oxidoreductase [Lysinibacter sp. HNR]|uniref:phytoene desaturase family protein n=1 Tax=Lysinibacter sp. HNR TaxID=3031408 RepID=UPI002434992B|nr:NAD(P)/FAD-dependent oxidoreductase [Lysinibacter sp. HNR]WGD37059.1 NAD(P)/FAD-dependent oxidoreductase [Lysinibacter sp. HNR]
MVTDAVVVGAGPNGLAAAVILARAGIPTTLYEAENSIGGGLRTGELTLPGFLHDECSAVHPLVLASPFFRAFQLGQRMDFVVPDISYAHPLSDSPTILAHRDVAQTAAQLGVDGSSWKKLMNPLIRHSRGVRRFVLDQLLQVPRDPIAAAVFGLRTLEQGTPLGKARFSEDRAPALLAGVTAHTPGRMPGLANAGAGLILASLAHTSGWPLPVGGSRSIARALAGDFEAHGGRIVTGERITYLEQVGHARAIILDISPTALISLAGNHLPTKYVRALREYRLGAGAFKIDFALAEPVPWKDPNTALSPTVHLGGSREQIAAAERDVARGKHPENPYILVTQPTAFDPTRAPVGKHTLWAYTHVPNGSSRDLTERIIGQIERYAPGFRDTILAVSARPASALAAHNTNYVGGDFLGGAVDLRQMIKRPVVSTVPWATPLPHVFLGSASTPPGPSVHGMGGYYAARTALRRVFGLGIPELGKS